MAKEILDEDYTQSAEIIQKALTPKIGLRSVIYFTIMVIGGFPYYWTMLDDPQSYSYPILFIGTLIIIAMCCFLSFILELFRLLSRKRKARKTGKKIIQDPFWFQVLEGGFGIWIMFAVLYIVTLFLK